MDTTKVIQQLSSGKDPGEDAIPTRPGDTRPGDTHGKKSDRIVSLYVEEGGYPKHLLSTYTSGKEILRSVTTTETCPSKTSVELPEYIIMIRRGLYQNVSVDSEKTERR